MLLRHLLRLIFDPERSDRTETVLRSFSEREWEECTAVLRLHRIGALVWSTLRDRSLTDVVPFSCGMALHDDHWSTQAGNRGHRSRLAEMLSGMQQRDVDPIVLKGMALLGSVYPDEGARPMDDIDLLVELASLPAVDSTLTELGFQAGKSLADGLVYSHDDGTSVDVHFRFRLFDRVALEGLTTRVALNGAATPSMLVFEPNAMLVHLSHHLDGHRRSTGYLLKWIADVAMVLDRCGAQLDTARLIELMPAERTRTALARVVGFADRELGVTAPAELSQALGDVVPVTLAEVLRSRRRSVWDLREVRGWLALGACTARLHKRGTRPLLSPIDLILWPLDAWHHKRASRVRS